MNKTVKAGTNRRLSIGFLVDWASDYQMSILLGAVDAAKANDVNLFCVEGGCIHSKLKHQIQRNITFDLVNEDSVDGLIILSATIGHFASQEQTKTFCHRYQPLPMISIAQEVEGCSTVMVDSGTGLRELIEHLLTVHQYRRFAFIKGPQDNQDSDTRMAIIQTILKNNGIDMDKNLIFTGDFTPISGEEAVKTLFGQNNAPIDVLFSLSDGMALGALEELNRRGIRVPEEVAVVGFDDFPASAFSNPPLTTVNQSLYNQGAYAVERIIKMITEDGEAQTKYLPSKLVIRESCGCYSRNLPMGGTDRVACVQGNVEALMTVGKQALIDAVVRKAAPVFPTKQEPELPALIERMVDSLYHQIYLGKKQEFLKFCHELLRDYRNDVDIFLWQNVLSEFRRNLLSSVAEGEVAAEMEEAFHQARVIVGEKAIEREKIIYNESLQNNMVINRMSEDFLCTTHIGQMLEIVDYQLPNLGITSFFIAKFIGKTRKTPLKQQALLMHNKQGRVEIPKNDLSGMIFDGLIPAAVLSDDQQHAYLISALNFAGTQFGAMGLELVAANSSNYGALHGIICGSLNGVVLTRQVKKQEKSLISQKEHIKNLAEMKKAMEGFIRTFQLTIDARDPYTAGHQERVADLAQAIALKMRLSPERVEGVRIAGIVHDFGKISVPASILAKPGRLEPLEFQLVQEHPTTAYNILKNVDFPWSIAEPILQHHERLDGSGYPNGLVGNDICLEARILVVADVIEAMASHRPYRPALGMEQALKEIVQNQGKYYDEAVVDACVELFTVDGYQLPEI